VNEILLLKLLLKFIIY